LTGKKKKKKEKEKERKKLAARFARKRSLVSHERTQRRENGQRQPLARMHRQPADETINSAKSGVKDREPTSRIMKAAGRMKSSA